MSFIELGHFGCFDVSIIMLDAFGVYGLEGIFELWRNVRNWRFLSLD